MVVTGRVVVVGSVNVDLVVRIARLPAAGETVGGGTFGRFHGGKGGNQAVAAARLGTPTVFIGALGSDDFGAEARAALESEGIDTSHLVTLEGAQTGVALILVDERGENAIGVASGANLALDSERVAGALAEVAPRPGDVLLTGAEIPLPAVIEALRIGQAAGATTVLNPAPAEGIGRSVLELVDVLTPNQTELSQILALDDRRAGRTVKPGAALAQRTRSLLESGPEGSGVRSAVVVTLGAAGALIVMRDSSRAGANSIRMIDVAAQRVVPADTTGAGDTLSGALAAGLAEGRPLQVAVERAVAAAALSTTVAGARQGMPSREALERFLRTTGQKPS